jgi:hypothetical protein
MHLRPTTFGSPSNKNLIDSDSQQVNEWMMDVGWMSLLSLQMLRIPKYMHSFLSICCNEKKTCKDLHIDDFLMRGRLNDPWIFSPSTTHGWYSWMDTKNLPLIKNFYQEMGHLV